MPVAGGRIVDRGDRRAQIIRISNAMQAVTRNQTIFWFLGAAVLSAGATALWLNHTAANTHADSGNSGNQARAAIMALNESLEELNRELPQTPLTDVSVGASENISNSDEQFLQRLVSAIVAIIKVEGNTSPTNGITPINTVDKSSKDDDIMSTAAKATIVYPTAEQFRIYSDVKAKFDDPVFVRTLSLPGLLAREDIRSLPKPLVDLLIGQAIEKFTRGEISREVFTSRPKLTQP